MNGTRLETSLMRVTVGASGRELINVLHAASIHELTPKDGVDFGDREALWRFVLEYCRQLLITTAEMNAIHAIAGGGRGRRPYYSLARIFEAPEGTFNRIPLKRADLVAAMVIQVHSPDLLDAVPPSVSSELGGLL